MNLRRLLAVLTLTLACGALATPALAHDRGDDQRRGDDQQAAAGTQEPNSDAPKDDDRGDRCARAERKLDRLYRRQARLERRIERLEDLLATGEFDDEEAIEIEDRIDRLADRLDETLDRIDWLEGLIAEKCTPPATDQTGQEGGDQGTTPPPST